MSHTTTLKGLQVRSVSAMRSAVAALAATGINCALRDKGKPRMYYEDQGEVCDYVLDLPDCPYDVGFQKNDDGTYAAVFDEWRGNIAGQIGADPQVCPMPDTDEGRAQHQIGRFMQEYAKAAAIEAANAQGYMVQGVTTDQKGNVQVQIAV